MRKDIKSLTLSELNLDLGLNNFNTAKYVPQQIYSWLNKGCNSFEDMSNISQQLRSKLSEVYHISDIKIACKQKSHIDDTIKYLFLLEDGEFIETVVMKYMYGYSICLSTQVGCKMGCKFCATARCGFRRNLSPAEILLQIQKVQTDLNIKIKHIVIMGMGEPLDNLQNILKFIKLVSDEHGQNIGKRHITVSTCGVADKISVLSSEEPQVTLSVSLHAPNDYIRNQLMPINKKFPLHLLMEACIRYTETTRKRISFEYTMIENLNDTECCAKELAILLGPLKCHLNLIPLNEIENSTFSRSKMQKIRLFERTLQERNINVTIRRTLGRDIMAACGQLRNRKA